MLINFSGTACSRLGQLVYNLGRNTTTNAGHVSPRLHIVPETPDRSTIYFPELVRSEDFLPTRRQAEYHFRVTC